MGVIGWIIVGLLAGGLARWVVKDDRSGCLYTMIVGVLGALIGGALMNAADKQGIGHFGVRSILVAALGAVLCCSSCRPSPAEAGAVADVAWVTSAAADPASSPVGASSYSSAHG